MTGPWRPATAAVLAGILLTATGCTADPAPPVGSGPSRQGAAAAAPVLAPYLDVTLPAPPGLEAALGGTARQVRLAFVTAGRGCLPLWGRDRPLDDPEVLALAGRLRQAGVEPVPSFGGALPGEPALACRTPEALADLYGSVLARLGTTVLDLDLEGPALTDRATVRRRNQAVLLLRRRLAAAGSRLTVTWTVPADPSGPSRPALAALRAARQDGALPDRVDVMAMNLGTGSVGPEAVRRVTSGAVRALRELRPELAPDRAAAAVGVVVMIGVNDLPDEVLQPADAARVSADARADGLGGLSFWSLNRDRPCPCPCPPRAVATCSGVDQEAGDFLRGLAGIGNPDADRPRTP